MCFLSDVNASNARWCDANSYLKDMHYFRTSLLAVLAATPLLHAQRVLVDFGRGVELTPSPDIFGQHWNNLPDAGLQVNSTIVDDGGNATTLTLEVIDDFAAVSTNTIGGEPIYVPTASGDFAYTTKSNSTAVVLVRGLDASSVYDFKFFVTTNRQAPQSFLTDYTVAGATSETVSLEAVGNRQDVVGVNGMAPDGSGEIMITIATADSSSDFGALGVLEIVGRDPASPVAPDPQPGRWSNDGGTPNPDAAPNPDNPEGLTAYVFETADGFSGHIGAGESLRRAGFHVEPLPLDRPPFDFLEDPEADVDLILFGSFVSQDPQYAAYMEAYAEILDDYVDRAGYLLQLSQADQTEVIPPFLPDTQDAARIDNDYPEALILSPDHPMIQGFPTNPAGSIFYTQPHIAPHFDDVIWEAFTSFAGFEVILSGDERARFPALMEGAYGQGQLLLASMAPDKIINSSTGLEQADPAYTQINQAFFDNL